MTADEAAQRRMAAWETAYAQLLHSISHDMRAPVRHVTSYTPLLRAALQAEPPQVPEALEYLAALEQSARHLTHMLEGVQTLAHTASVPLHLQAVALQAAIAAARAALPDRTHMQWLIAENLPTIWADHRLLHPLLLHLLDNAGKFTQHCQHPVVCIDSTSSAIANYTRIRIRDNGIGFDQTRAHKLFGIFQRMHRAADFDGLGIGLALCQTIARRHDAHIALEAAPGQGCTVWLDWPTPPASSPLPAWKTPAPAPR